MKINVDVIYHINYKRCVYYIKNLNNNKMYIGSTKRELKWRLYEHFNEKDSNNSLHKDLRLYPRNNFEFGIFCHNVPESILRDLEMKFINFYNTKQNGYNQIDENGLSQEAHIRQSLAHIGMKLNFTEEHKKNISKSKIGAEYLQGGNNPSARKVLCYNDKEEYTFDCIQDGIDFIKDKFPKYKSSEDRSMCGAISQVCKGKRKTAYNYKWRYL